MGGTYGEREKVNRGEEREGERFKRCIYLGCVCGCVKGYKGEERGGQ